MRIKVYSVYDECYRTFDEMLNVDLLTVVIPFVAGVALGYFLRKRRKLSLNKATFWIIIILIFSLGFSMGSNNKLLISFPHVGLKTIVML